MKKTLTLGLFLLCTAGVWLAVFLFRPFLSYPEPAHFSCLDPEAGIMKPLQEPHRVFGLGLSYAGHIAESPGLYDPEAGPPIFRKRARSVNRSGRIPYPSREDLLEAAGRIDAGHAGELDRRLEELPALLDYEVEIGLVVLEDFAPEALSDSRFVPPLGYFVANDITARMLIGMAPEFAETVSYLAEGKSLSGFLPVGDRAFIPSHPAPDSWVCVDMVTEVNGEIRQRSSSRDIIYSPREILRAVALSQDVKNFQVDDWIITGTPPGVALQTPGWMQRGLLLVDPSAEVKVSAMAAGSQSAGFLQPGDQVRVSAGFLGEKISRIGN